MGTFLIFLLVLCLLWPFITKWLRGFAARRMEDTLRKMMGMPSRKEERRARSQSATGDSRQQSRRSRKGSSRSESFHRHEGEPIIPREYAEDVEFTETIDYSESTILEGKADGTRREWHESQVSDAQYVEIKEKK